MRKVKSETNGGYQLIQFSLSLSLSLHLPLICSFPLGKPNFHMIFGHDSFKTQINYLTMHRNHFGILPEFARYTD